MTIGEKILYMRKKAGLSQEELAEIVGVSRQAVSKWETGEAAPEVGKLLLLSRAFGVTADWLISDEGLPERKLEPEDRGDRDEPSPEEPRTGGAPPSNWVESVPGVLGRLLRRWGWLAGVYVAVIGAAFTLFGVLVRLLTRGFVKSASGGFGAMPGGWGFTGSFPFEDSAVSAAASPFATFGTVFIVLGLVLIVTGVVLAVFLKKKSGRR